MMKKAQKQRMDLKYLKITVRFFSSGFVSNLHCTIYGTVS